MAIRGEMKSSQFAAGSKRTNIRKKRAMGTPVVSMGTYLDPPNALWVKSQARQIGLSYSKFLDVVIRYARKNPIEVRVAAKKLK